MALLCLLLLSGCYNKADSPIDNDIVRPENNETAKIANPASAYCLEQGGSLETKSDQAGEYSVCVFPDGSKCEEWNFFQDRCQIGDNISIFRPADGNDISLPLIISGNARVFERNVNIRIREKYTNKMIYEGSTAAQAEEMGSFAEFDAVIAEFDDQMTAMVDEIIVDIYSSSAIDGSMENINTLSLFIK